MDEVDHADKVIFYFLSLIKMITTTINMKPFSMTRVLMLLCFLSVVPMARGQAALTLSDCYSAAEANYPLIRQRDLIARTKSFSIENASKDYLPEVTLGGQATYQSQVTQIPFEAASVPLSKDQYRVFGEVSQNLYHGGLTGQRKLMEGVTGEVEEQKLEVELYQIRQRVNDMFFGVLLVQEQIRQTDLIRGDLLSALKKVEASIANGTAIPSSADVLRAELLRVDQRTIEMESMSESYRRTLGLFMNQTIDAATKFVKPSFDDLPSAVNRPELRLFDTQKRALEVNEAILSAGKKPHVDAFVQAGYGRPGLNMLKNDFSFYYVGGVRFRWTLSAYYTHHNERQILNLRRQSLDVQKETFLFNTGLALEQHQTEISKLQRMIEVDGQIIALRSKVSTTAAVQLEEGVISSTDFVREVNAEDQAKQDRVFHETQLLLAKAKYQYTSGQ
jgi:outer membrane protein TolC